MRFLITFPESFRVMGCCSLADINGCAAGCTDLGQGSHVCRHCYKQEALMIGIGVYCSIPHANKISL